MNHNYLIHNPNHCAISPVIVFVNKYSGEPELELHHEAITLTAVPDGHKCKLCDKKYSYASNLRKHVRKYHRARAGRPPHLCGKCGRGYTEKHRLNSHVKTHDGKRFPCDLCNEDFAQKCNLARHIKRKHDRDD